MAAVGTVQDIEGTVAPISFVVEVLFPYAKARLRSHLEATFDRPPTQQVIHLFREQVRCRHSDLCASSGTCAASITQPPPFMHVSTIAVTRVVVGATSRRTGSACWLTELSRKLQPLCSIGVAEMQDVSGGGEGGTSAAQAVQDGKAAVPAAGSSAAEVVAAVVALAEGDMAADRKSTALKALQGHIWHGGFQDGQLVAQMYPDVAPALGSWAAAGIKVYRLINKCLQGQASIF